MHDNNLGRKLYITMYTLGGQADAELCQRLNAAIAIAIAIDMDMAGLESATWHYPLEGRGGVGFTMVQPITTSYMVWDTWPDHNAAYFQVVSCKPYCPEVIDRIFLSYFDLIERECRQMELPDEF